MKREGLVFLIYSGGIRVNNFTFNTPFNSCIKSIGNCSDPDIIIPVVQKIQNKVEIQTFVLGIIALLILVDLFNKWR